MKDAVKTPNNRRAPGRKRWPKYFHKKSLSYYIVRVEDGKRKWRNLGTDYDMAISEYHRLMTAEDAPQAPGKYKSYAHYLLKKSQYSASSRGLTNTLTIDDVRFMWNRAGGFCEVSRAPFKTRSKYKTNPWAASIDRINSSKPYTPKNCRLVCLAANVAMNQWGEDILIMLSNFVTSRDVYKASTKNSKNGNK